MAREFARAFYKSKQWQNTRAAYIRSVDGLCENCLKHGIYKPGYIVHHKKHLTPYNIDNPHVSLDFSNLEYLCFDCHSREHSGDNDEPLRIGFDENGNVIRKGDYGENGER